MADTLGAIKGSHLVQISPNALQCWMARPGTAVSIVPTALGVPKFSEFIEAALFILEFLGGFCASE